MQILIIGKQGNNGHQRANSNRGRNRNYLDRRIRAYRSQPKLNSKIGANSSESLSTFREGKSVVTGLAISLAKNKPLRDSCKLAVVMGTSAVLAFGTNPPRREDVQKILSPVKVGILA